jgi:mercuric reductase
MERRGIPCECRTIPAELIPKALTVGDTRGLLKIVVEAKRRRLRGVHVVSPIAADLIHAATYALRAGFSIDDLIDTVHVFPTFSEGLKIAAQSFYRDMSKVSCCIE